MLDALKAAFGLGPKPQGHFGWVQQPEDTRDHPFESLLAAAPPLALPASVDLRSGMPAVYDQGQLGSCTGNAIGAAIQFDQIKQGLPTEPVSRLFIYFNERSMEGTVNKDAGAVLRDGLKSVGQLGACPEVAWPYIISKFAVRPPMAAYLLASRHKALRYAAVRQTERDLKTALAAGFPIIFGFKVYPSFESAEVARTGVVPMPGGHETPIGGHAVICVGFDDAKRMFLVRNSWSAAWGDSGHFWMPYSYLTNPGFASDFWSLTLVN